MGWEEWYIIAPIVRFVLKALRFIFGRKQGPSVIQHIEVKQLFVSRGPMIVIASSYLDKLPQSQNEQVKRLFEEGLSRRWDGEYKEAIRLLRAGLSLEVTSDEKVALLILIGSCFLEQGRFEEAQGHCKEAEMMAQEANVTQGVVVAKTMLAYIALYGDDLDMAAQYKGEASRALVGLVGEDSDVWALQAAVHNLTGLIHLAKQELQNAWDNFQPALGFARKTGIPIMEVDALFGLALVYLTRGEWQRAVDELNKALTIVSTSNWYFARGSILAALAEAYEHKGERTRALDLHREALGIFVRIGNTELINQAINRLAELENKAQKDATNS